MTQVKICGVNSPAAFDAVVEAEADYLGFVFFPPSPRFVTPAEAAVLSARQTGGPLRTGLFVAPSDDEIAAVLNQVPLDILQIYADTDRAAAIKTKFGLAVWRAVGISTAANLPASDENLDGFVIEAKAPQGATRPGGNATAMDWALLETWQAPAFWLLGGGLTPNNVAAAINQTHPPGVDVSSGVETAPGVKSPDLIRRFVTAVHTKPKT